MNRTETFFRIVDELQDVYEGNIPELPTMLYDTKLHGDMKLTLFSYDTERFLVFTTIKKGVKRISFS